MPSRSHRTRAIILAHTKLAEQDLILTLLGESGAQERAVAKGGRKPGGRLAGRCDLFCESDLLLVKGRGSLEIVGEAHLLSAHTNLRADLDKTSAASAICEIASATCYEDSEDPFLYPICARALLACEQATSRVALDLILTAYAFKLLAHAGWRPELEFCVSCGDPKPERFSVSAGGMLCSSCARDIEGAELISPSQSTWISSLISMTFDEILECRCDNETAAWLASIAHQWAATHLDTRLRAFEFYASV